MATRTISLINQNTRIDDTGRCYETPLKSVLGSSIDEMSVFAFADPGASEDHGFFGAVIIPENFVQSAVVIPEWTSATATSGGSNVCRWSFAYKILNRTDDTNSIVVTSWTETVTITDLPPASTAGNLLFPTMTPTSGNFTSSASKLLTYKFFRSDGSGLDAMSGVALLRDLLFQYSDT